MSVNKYFEAFGKPFPADDVSWRLQYVNENELQGMAVPYLDARAIADRLDEVVGQSRWQDRYIPWHDCVMGKKQKSSQLCTISIYDEELKQWIDKTDGAEDSDIEPVKGGLSDAFKRAAVKWNIGRYLYGFDTIWVKVEKKRDSYIIAKSENEKLIKSYNGMVAKLFGANAVPGYQSPPANTSNKNLQKTQPTQQSSKPPEQWDTPVYEIRQIRVQEGQNGAKSAMLLFSGGKQCRAFLNGKDARLQTGTKIKNVRMETIESDSGKYHMLNAYDIAA